MRAYKKESMLKKVAVAVEISIALLVFVLYLTNRGNTLVQLVGIIALAVFLVVRVERIFKRKWLDKDQLVEISYVLTFILFIFFWFSGFGLLRERFYFANHRSEIENLVEFAEKHGCTLLIGNDYCDGYLPLPYELRDWTGQDQMFVIKKSDLLYIMFADFVYIPIERPTPLLLRSRSL
jgi:hypothetical protein